MYLKNLFLFAIIFSFIAFPVNLSNHGHYNNNNATTNSFNTTTIPPIDIKIDGNNSSYPSIAQSPNGTIVIAYQKMMSNRSYILYSISKNGGRSFSRPTIINNTATNSSMPTIIYSNNMFYIAYNAEINNSYHLYITQLSNSGTIINTISIANTNNTPQKFWMYPSNGTIYIAYSINGSLYLTTYNGSIPYSLISINAIANGLIVYENYIYVLARTGNNYALFEYNMSSIGWQDMPIPYINNPRGMPTMALSPTGNILITWAGHNGIYLYNVNMPSYTTIYNSNNSLYENPYISVLKNEFLLTWAQSNNGSSNWNIYSAISNNGINYTTALKTSMHNGSGIATLPFSISSSILPNGVPIVSWVSERYNETSIYSASLYSFINVSVKNTACGCLLQNSELILNGSVYSHEYKITNGRALIPIGPENAYLKILAPYFSTYSSQIKINLSSLINIVVYLSLEVPKYTNETVIVSQVGTGFPIYNATVNLSINNVIIYSQKTNELGVAYFKNITPSTYAMSVFKSGYKENVSIVNTSTQSIVYVSLYPTTPTYFGKLVVAVYNASTHKAIPNAIVYLNSSTISYIGVTNSSGMLMFKSIKAGVYKIYVNATGYSNYSSIIGIKANITNVYDIGLIETTGQNSSIYSNIGNGNTIFAGNVGIVENALLAIILVIVIIVSAGVGLASEYYSKKEKKNKKEKELIDYMDQL